MKITCTVSVTSAITARMKQVSAMFDAPAAAKMSRTWTGQAPIEERPWQIGLIVGPSGCGKSTVAREMFGAPAAVEWGTKAIVDEFPTSMSVPEITAACSAVGFNTIPAWLRPFHTLSNGEQFRVTLARLISTQAPNQILWVDEFTSVVDRQVAKVGSHAVQKYARRNATKFVAVSCHYDVIDWLQPDWILEPATMSFDWRLLQRRPAITVDIKRCSHALWQLFAPYHYLSAELIPSARCFSAYVDGQPVAFVGVVPFPHPTVRDIARVSRVVTLPDWQGLGLAFVLMDTLAAAYKAKGKRLRTYPAHAGLVTQFLKHPSWVETKRFGTFASGRNSGSISTARSANPGGQRPCGTFEWCGEAMDERQASRLLAVGR